MPSEPTRQELFELYRIAIDEYRFEVKLNTDRMIQRTPEFKSISRRNRGKKRRCAATS